MMSVHDPETKRARGPRSIPVRRPAFDFERVKDRHWFGGDPFMTHLLEALSLTFPEGERFFMDSVRHYQEKLDSPVLRHEVSRFLAQEGMHGRVHAAFNAWVRELGNDTGPIEEHVKSDLARARREAGPREKLAVTCALEHFTAILAEVFLENHELREQIEPEIRRLWIWHAVEETEHKAVAFDTYVATGGTYHTRVIAMLVTTFQFVRHIAKYQTHLMKGDPAPRARFAGLRGLYKMWIAPGTLLPAIPAYLDYFRPDFHPWQRAPKATFTRFRDAVDADAARGAA